MTRQCLAGEQYRLTFRGKMNGVDVWENVHYYRMFLQTAAGCDEVDFASAFWAHLTGYSEPLASVITSFDAVGIQRVNANGAPNRPSVTYTIPGAVVGSVAGDALPNILAGVISLQTALVGSRYRGRTFLPPTGEGQNGAAGYPTGAWMTAAIAYCVQMMANVTGTTGGNATRGELVVLSRAHSTSEAVTNAFPVQRWGRQVRRTAGRGI